MAEVKGELKKILLFGIANFPNIKPVSFGDDDDILFVGIEMILRGDGRWLKRIDLIVVVWQVGACKKEEINVVWRTQKIRRQNCMLNMQLA